MSRSIVSDSRGFTLVEVVVAMLVLSFGIASTFKVFNTTKRSNLNALRSEAVATTAQREMEKLRTLAYKDLGVSQVGLTDAVGSGNWSCPADGVGRPCKRVTSSAGPPSCPQLQITTSGAPLLYEPMVMSDTNCQTTADPLGKVDPYDDQVQVSIGNTTVNMRVWRYVTWRDEKCAAECPESPAPGRDSKRLVVAVLADQGVGPTLNPKPIWLSSVVIDPNAAPAAITDPTPLPPKNQTTPYYLYDAPCGSGGDVYPYAGRPSTHPTDNTSVVPGFGLTARSTCGSAAVTDRPNLMGETEPTLTNNFKYSNDAPGPPAPPPSPGASLEIEKGNPGGCQTTQVFNKRKVHVWTTPPLSDAGKRRIKDTVIFNFYVANAGPSTANEHICLSLAKRSAGDGADCAGCVLGSADPNYPCVEDDVPSWSGSTSVKPVSCSFPLDAATSTGTDPDDQKPYWDVASGQRLALTVSVYDDSASNLFLLYDHATYASYLQVSTCRIPNNLGVGGSTCVQP